MAVTVRIEEVIEGIDGIKADPLDGKRGDGYGDGRARSRRRPRCTAARSSALLWREATAPIPEAVELDFALSTMRAGSAARRAARWPGRRRSAVPRRPRSSSASGPHRQAGDEARVHQAQRPGPGEPRDQVQGPRVPADHLRTRVHGVGAVWPSCGSAARPGRPRSRCASSPSGSSVGYRPSTSRQDPGFVGFRRAGHAPRRGTAPGIPPKDLDNGCNWQPPPRRPRAVRTGHALARKTARQAAAPAGNRSACVP